MGLRQDVSTRYFDWGLLDEIANGRELSTLEWLTPVRLVTCISPAKVILAHEQGQTPDSLKRSYENASLGQQWLRYAVF
jgi:hypothetical protein